MADANAVIDKLGEQIKNMGTIIAVLQTELEELRKAKDTHINKGPSE